jgi:spore coat protein U-like protein
VATLLAPVSAWGACTASGVGPALGVYSSESPLPADAVGQVSIRCTGVAGLLTNYTLSLSTGQSGRFYTRRMLASAGDGLSYQIYSDLTRLLVWGDGTGGTNVVNGSALLVVGGVTNVHFLYG